MRIEQLQNSCQDDGSYLKTALCIILSVAILYAVIKDYASYYLDKKKDELFNESDNYDCEEHF